MKMLIPYLPKKWLYHLMINTFAYLSVYDPVLRGKDWEQITFEEVCAAIDRALT